VMGMPNLNAGMDVPATASTPVNRLRPSGVRSMVKPSPRHSVAMASSPSTAENLAMSAKAAVDASCDRVGRPRLRVAVWVSS
jgi:hypothetical protein